MKISAMPLTLSFPTFTPVAETTVFPLPKLLDAEAVLEAVPLNLWGEGRAGGAYSGGWAQVVEKFGIVGGIWTVRDAGGGAS